MSDAKETQIAKLVISLQAKTDALEKGLNNAKKKLQEMEQENDNIKGKNKELEASYIAMSAVAVASLVKITGIIKECVNEYNSYTQAMASLRNVSEYTGQSMEKYSEIMSKYSAYLTQTDIAATIKNFSLMGFTVEQTDQMIQSLTNSAIRNRNANYTVSEAVKVASDGYKQGLSTLSDSAGVTENLSVMLDEYAKTLGKTASQLTETEKNQAYLNRTMIAAEPFASAMSDYMDNLAGKQGQYSQAMRETQVAYGEALEPALKNLIDLVTGILQGMTSLIKSNPELVAGATAMTVTLAVLTLGIIALKKAKDAYTKSTLAATVATKGFAVALMANPAMLVVSAISLLVGALTTLGTALDENVEKQSRLNEAKERYKEIVNGQAEYTNDYANEIKQNTENLKKQIDLYLQLDKLYKERGKRKGSLYILYDDNGNIIDKMPDLDQKIKNTEKELKNLQDSTVDYENDIGALFNAYQEGKKYLEEYEKVQKASTVLDTDVIRNKKKEASQLVNTAKEHRKYLNIIKSGNQNTNEYVNAVNNLAKVYPEAVSASGPLINELDILIKKEEETANTSYNSTQSIIQDYKNILTNLSQDDSKMEQVAENLGIPVDELIPKLKNAISLYEVLYEKTADEMGGTYKQTNNTSTSYQNKALDNYKKQIEYKKNLDKISSEEEIKMYEYALNKLAKTSDEKMDLEVQVYQLRKKLVEDFIEKEKESLDERTENSNKWIEEQNLSVEEQEKAYERIIAYHKEYLDKMVSDERLSLEQKDKIWKEEVNTIKDYQKQIRDLKIETTNNVYEALKNALTKQADEMQEIEENAINKSLSALEKSKKQKIEMINEEYNAKIKAIEDELKAIEDAEKKKSRQEEQDEYEKKKKRLEDLIAYEHDAVTKSSYEKELTKLNSEYQKSLDKYALEDKKEALNSEKDRLKDEQDAKIDSINEKYEKEKEYLDNRLEIIQANYDKEREMADKNAQIMLLNTEQHQTEIINLLKTYGDEYELLGKTWGEKVVDAFEEKVKGIIDTVTNLNSQLNQAIDNKMANLASKATGSVTSSDIANKKAYSQTNRSEIERIARNNGVDMSVAESIYKSRKNTTVIQNNTFNVPTEKPSSLLKKLQKTAQSFGELLRGS